MFNPYFHFSPYTKKDGKEVFACQNIGESDGRTYNVPASKIRSITKLRTGILMAMPSIIKGKDGNPFVQLIVLKVLENDEDILRVMSKIEIPDISSIERPSKNEEEKEEEFNDSKEESKGEDPFSNLPF